MVNIDVSHLEGEPNAVKERIRKYRDEHGFPEGVFLPADAPLAARRYDIQERIWNELGEIASAEGSSLQPDGWVDLVDPSLSAEANKQLLLEQGGRLPEWEREEERIESVSDYEEAARRSAGDQIREYAEYISYGGHAPSEALELLLEDPTADVPGAEVDTEQVGEDLVAMRDEFGQAFMRDVFDELRESYKEIYSEYAFSTVGATGDDASVDELREDVIQAVRDIFDVQRRVVSIPDALDAVRERVDAAEARAERARREEREQLVARLSRGFGVRFESIEGAIEWMRDRIRQSTGTDFRETGIILRHRDGEPLRVRFEAFDDDVFEAHRGRVERRIRDDLNVENVSGVQTRVGTIRVRDGDLLDIDLTPGVRKLGGTLSDPEFDDPDDITDEPASDADAVADEMLAALGGDDA